MNIRKVRNMVFSWCRASLDMCDDLKHLLKTLFLYLQMLLLLFKIE